MNMELADVDTGSLQSSGPSVRDSIESAVAVSSTTSPDIESNVAGALNNRDRDNRAREMERRPSRHGWEAEVRDKRHSQIREAFAQEKAKTSAGASAPRAAVVPETGQVTMSPGAPASWDSTAKAHWDNLPQETRLAIQRDHAGFARHSQEIETALAPSREEFKKHGLSSSQAVAKMVEWERSLANPATRAQAFQALAHQYGIQVGGSGPGPQQHYVDPQESQRVQGTLQQFSRGRPHYEAVRGSMGLLIHQHPERYLSANGGCDLDRAYQDACKFEGVGAVQPQRSRGAARQPAVAPAQHRGATVRESIAAARRGA